MRWWSQGFAGEQPLTPAHLVERPELLDGVVTALGSRDRLVAVAGVAGAGKSTLARQAGGARPVQRAFRDGIAWVEVGPGKHPVVLLADLASRLGLPPAAASFGTEEQGREQLITALRGRRVLIVADDVREAGQLEAITGLAPKCTVLFTTRQDKLAHEVKAKQVVVGELTPDQAMGLLGRWTGEDPEALPYGARDLCAQAGNLALGVALAGAMAAQGQALGQVLAAVKEHAAAERGSAPEALFSVIEASIDDLPEADQGRYAQLAVFAGRGPFPHDAARTLWPTELPDAEADGLLERLTARNLLTAVSEGWYEAHLLQYDAMALRLGAAGLTAAHAQLLKRYRLIYPDGWADSASDPYLGRALASHLHNANLGDELRAVLTDPAWIEARIAHGPLPDLIPDYKYAGDPLTRQILRTLRMSAPVLAADPTQVRGQLVDRLMGQPDPGITAWAAGLTGQASGPAPQLASLVLADAAKPLEQILAGHTDQVRAVAVSPDGQRAVSGSDDGSVRVWDLDAGREQAVLTGHTDWVRAVAVTADGARAVSGSDDGSVRVWDLAEGREEAALTGHAGEVFSVALTPDGALAVSGGSDGSVRVWDLAEGREQATLAGHTRPVWSVAVAPDGKRAVSGSGDGSVRVWDLAEGREEAALTGHAGEVFSVAVTADGTRAVTGGSDGSVRVWDLDAGRDQDTLTGHSGWVRAVAVTPDGQRAVSGGEDGSVRVWDLDAGREQATLTGHARQVFSVAVTPDGTRAVTGGQDGSVRTWDLSADREEAPPAGREQPVPASAAPAPADGEQAAPADRKPATDEADRQPATAAADGEQADAADRKPAAAADGEQAAAAAAADGEQAAAADRQPAAARKPADLSGWTFAVAITPDGTRAVSGSDDGTVRTWDLATGRAQVTLTGHTRPAWSVAITPDGRRAVSGSSDGTVRVWNLATGREEATLTGHTRPVWSVAITRDGKRAVSGSSDGTVRIWDLAGEREQASLTSDDRQVFAVAVTPDGTRVVSGNGNDLQVWDLGARQARATLTGHTGEVFAVAVTPDGKYAVSGSSDGTVRIWDLSAGREEAVLTGHDRQVFAVAVTPDKALAVSGGEDGSVRVWDVATRTEVARWTGDYPIVGCSVIPGQTVRIGVGQRQGSPFLLELLGTPGSDSKENPAGQDQQARQRGDKAKAGARWRPWSPGSAAATATVRDGRLAG
jgi:WD40 repeat protein